MLPVEVVFNICSHASTVVAVVVVVVVFARPKRREFADACSRDKQLTEKWLNRCTNENFRALSLRFALVRMVDDIEA